LLAAEAANRFTPAPAPGAGTSPDHSIISAYTQQFPETPEETQGPCLLCTATCS
jgi:hypothetical protein